MFSRRSLSFDGKLFFLYDREAVTSERDPPENAIIYFYPSSASIENRVSICGQLVGMSNFLTTVLDFAPVLINLKTEKVALCQSGQYTLALGGSMNEPETLLIRQLQNVFDVFVFYHGSLDTVRKLSKDHAAFLTNMSIIWDCYMHFIRNYGDTLPAVFNPLPFLKTPKNSSGCFLKASHILQACQRRHHILGGCILHQKSVLCTQLETNITKRLLLLKPNQSHHPGKQVKTEIQLPFGVRFLDSFVTCCEYERLIKALQKSPYQNSTKRSKPRPSSDSPKQQQSKSKTTAHQSAQENPNLQSTSKPTTDESAKDSSDLKLNIKPTSESAKGSSDLKSTSELRASESAKDSSDIKLRVSPTTSESAIERSDLQSTSELTTNESLDSLDDKESSDLKPTSKLTTGESAKENMDSKQLTNSGTEKRSKVVKTQSINTDNGSAKKGELCHPHKSNESKLDSNEKESERSLNGKRKDEINENDCTVDDSTSDGMLNGNSLESSTDSFDQCTDKIVNQYPKENDINDDDKEPLLQGTDLTMDEIDISGLRIVNGNSTRSCRDINKKVINDQDFHDPFRDINDQAVMDHDFCGPNRDINDQAVLDHDVLDLSRNMNSEAITDKDFVGPSKDLDVEVIRDEHAPQNEEVLICGELINSLIEQVINQCEDNANCGTACGVSVSKEISLSLSKKCEVGDQITCGSANCALRENDKVAEELLQLANDVDVNAHNISTEDDCYCDSAENDVDINLHTKHEDDNYCDSAENAEGLDTSHQARSPPIDLPGLRSHGDQVNRFSNPHVHESLCSPNEEFHDTVEEFDSEMKFTPRTVNAFMNSYHGLKSNVSMTGKYSDLNLNHPCDKAMDKSFFNDLIVSDKLETTIGNDHCSGDIPSRSASSISQGTESHRSEGSGRESGFSYSISSESPTHRCTVDCQTNLGDSGLCLFHGSSESSLSQVDGASESLLSQVDGASESSLSQVDGASESSLSQVDGANESSLSQVDGASNNPDMQQESPVESEHSSTSTTDLEMSTTTVTGDVEEKQKEQAEYVDEFDENLYQIDGLVHINLYVQAHSNTVLILLADPSLSQDQETIKALWKTTLNELGELEVHLNQCSKTDAERRDKPDDYSFVVYDVISCTTKGNLTEPVEQVDFKFCDTAKTVHEQFNNCTSLKSVTLRDNSSAVHCQRSLGQEVYFHKKGSLKPFRGSPSTRDSTFSLERRAPKHLKKDYGVNII